MTPLLALSSNPFLISPSIKILSIWSQFFHNFHFSQHKIDGWSNRESQSIHIFPTNDLGTMLDKSCTVGVRRCGGSTVFQSQAQGQGRTSEIGCRERSVRRAAPLLALGEKGKRVYSLRTKQWPSDIYRVAFVLEPCRPVG